MPLNNVIKSTLIIIKLIVNATKCIHLLSYISMQEF